jgi:hypothetical protein
MLGLLDVRWGKTGRFGSKLGPNLSFPNPRKSSPKLTFITFSTSATHFNTFRRLFVVQFIVDREEKQKFKEFASEESSEGQLISVDSHRNEKGLEFDE